MNIDGINAKRRYSNDPVNSFTSKQVKKNKVSEAGTQVLSHAGVSREKKINKKIELLKEEFSLGKRIFLSLFSRKYELLTKLTPFFGNTAMENLSKHNFLRDNSPENKRNREKMLATLNHINQKLKSKNDKKECMGIGEEGTENSFKWHIGQNGALYIIVEEKNKPQKGIHLNKNSIEDYNIPSDSLRQDSLEVNYLVSQFEQLDIKREHVCAFLKMKKENYSRAVKTLEEVLNFIKNPANKDKKAYKNLDKNKNFGWSIDKQGNVYIRTEQTLGRGANKKFTKVFCMNNGKLYAGASPVKIPAEEKNSARQNLIDPSKLKETQGRLRKYEKDLKDNESTVFKERNLNIIKNEENLKILKEAKIPNVSSEAVATFTAKSKFGNEKKFYVYELFSTDASKAFNLDKETDNEVDHTKFIKEKRDDVYFTIGKMSNALSALHDAGKVHGDVKPLNIGLFLDENGKVNDAKLFDWDGMVNINESAGDGTPLYNEPWNNNRNDKNLATTAKDAYSLGATFAHILFGKKFNNPINEESITNLLKDLNLDPGEEEIVKEILIGLLNPNADERMACKEASQLIDKLMRLPILNDFQNSGFDEEMIKNATLLLEGNSRVEYVHTLRDIFTFINNPENKNKTHSERSRMGETFGWSIDSKGNIYIRTKELLGKPGANKKFTKVLCLNNGKIFANAGPNKNIPEGLKNINFLSELKDYETMILSDFNTLTLKNNENIKILNELGIPNVPKESKADFEMDTKLKSKKIISMHKLFDSDAQFLAPENPEPNHVQKNKKSIFLIMEKVSETLSELHKKGYYHGDVKPLNIAVNFDNDKEIKKVILFDWDDMKKIGEKCAKFGTGVYLAPECGKKEFIPSGAKDAYALGVTFAHFLFGGEFIQKKITPEGIESKLKELMLDSNIEKNTLKEILLGLLEVDPQKRMTCEKAHSLIASLSGY